MIYTFNTHIHTRIYILNPQQHSSPRPPIRLLWESRRPALIIMKEYIHAALSRGRCNDDWKWPCGYLRGRDGDTYTHIYIYNCLVLLYILVYIVWACASLVFFYFSQCQWLYYTITTHIHTIFSFLSSSLSQSKHCHVFLFHTLCTAAPVRGISLRYILCLCALAFFVAKRLRADRSTREQSPIFIYDSFFFFKFISFSLLTVYSGST